MPAYIRVPLAVELLLMVVEYAWPASHAWLPLGGNHLMQLGILLVFGISVRELTGGPRVRR